MINSEFSQKMGQHWREAVHKQKRILISQTAQTDWLLSYEYSLNYGYMKQKKYKGPYRMR